MKTVDQWLAIPEAECGLALAEVLRDKPWKHDVDLDRYGFGDCKKCRERIGHKYSPEHCSVPDPIVIDWNTAMEWARKSHALRFEAALIRIFDIVCPDGDYHSWTLFGVTAEELLIAAAMAQEQGK